MIACSLCNISAKNYQNQLMYVEVIAFQRQCCFFMGRSVDGAGDMYLGCMLYVVVW